MKFVDKSKEAKRALTLAAVKSLTEICMMVEAQAVLLAPVDKGGLRKSIGYKVNESELVAYVGTNCEYAIYVEFGTGDFAEAGNGRKGGWLYETPDGEVHFTHGMRPQKYLRPAFEQNKKQIQEILKKIYKQLGG